MRLLLFAVTAALGTIAVGASADAANYPWCALYNKGGGEISCAFTTWEQCLTDVSGIGGFCEPNNTYSPAAAVPHTHRPARHKSKAS